jgi:hypothetical protein
MTESGLTPAGPGPGDAPPDSIQALTEEIRRTREDVGETVAALAAKADIMARARAKASEVAGRLRDTAGKVKQQATVPRAAPGGPRGSMRGPARRCPDRAPAPEVKAGPVVFPGSRPGNVPSRNPAMTR